MPRSITNRVLRFAVAALLGALSRATTATAQTDEIQVYDGGIAPVGAFNLTVHDNYVSSGSRTAGFPGAIIPDKSLSGAAEWAYGVAPWFEAGLYFPLYSITHNGSVLYNGMKLRALFVTPNADPHGFVYGINFEFSVNSAHWDERRYTSEIRPILAAHVGPFDFIFNPIVDNSWNGFSRLEFVPATRIAFTLSPRCKLALEEYADFGRISHFLPASQQSHQIFGVVDIETHGLSLEVGFGAGLTSASDHRVFKLILSKDL